MPDNPLPPIVGVVQYRNDLVVKRRGDAPQSGGGKRKQVQEFSKASRRRLAFVASNSPARFRTMVTLTYPKEFPRDGRKVKRDLRVFLAALRRYTQGTELLWFLEFQRRGAPHVHILMDHALPGKRQEVYNFRKWVAYRWYTICGQLDPKHLYAGTRTETIRAKNGGGWYAVKYAQKMEQKRVPDEYQNVGRFWGHTKGVTPVPVASYRCTEDDMRGLLDGWEHAPKADRPIYKVLYNCADRLTRYLAGGLDKTDDSSYTGCNSQYPTAPPKADLRRRKDEWQDSGPESPSRIASGDKPVSPGRL